MAEFHEPHRASLAENLAAVREDVLSEDAGTYRRGLQGLVTLGRWAAEVIAAQEAGTEETEE